MNLSLGGIMRMKRKHKLHAVRANMQVLELLNLRKQAVQ